MTCKKCQPSYNGWLNYMFWCWARVSPRTQKLELTKNFIGTNISMKLEVGPNIGKINVHTMIMYQFWLRIYSDT